MDSFGFLSRAHHLSTESHGSSMRTGTPTLPPGLPVPQSHLAPTLLQSPLDPSSPASPAPFPPPGLGSDFPPVGTEEAPSRHQSPEAEDTPEAAPPSSRVKNVSQISLGSPVPKSAQKARSQSKDELTPIGDKRESSSTTTKSKPMKLDLPINTAQPSESSLSKVETSIQSAHGQAPPSAIGSRPNTPLTGVSRMSDSSIPRQHRVLRVVDTPKNETPPPVSANQSISSNPITAKARSRRPSISSLSRPETPGDGGSEGDQYTSASVSRANSPPASSRIGSAPVRSMTKSQAKKERRQKAKEAEAKKHEAVLVEEPVQAPIVGRKRKTKKTPASTNEPSSAVAADIPEPGHEPEQPAKTEQEPIEKGVDEESEAVKKTKAKEKPSKEEKPSPVAEKVPDADTKLGEEAWRAENTVEQMLKDAESGGGSIKELFTERTHSLQALLAQLHKSGVLDLNNHPLFNPANLSQRFDMKCSADDYEGLKHPIELTDEDRRTLLRGEPIRINADSDMLKDRCLISPRGCILHHLSPEEEERYLALEKSIVWAIDSFQDYSAVPITEPDVTNRGGGLDALFATPENFNICWVGDASAGLSPASPTTSGPGNSIPHATTVPPNVLSAMEADSTRSHNWAIANTAELVNATAASVRSFAAATAKHMLGAAGVVMGNIPDLDDVVGMTDEELRSFAVKSHKELETSRKELDSIDKKLNALVKRNKKLAQQALATTVEG